MVTTHDLLQKRSLTGDKIVCDFFFVHRDYVVGRSIAITACVHLYVCPQSYLKNQASKNFTKFSLHVAHGRGLVSSSGGLMCVV